MLQSNGKVSNNSDFIFYLQPTSSNGSVEHMLGILNEGVRSEDDDDEIRIRLASIPKNISKLVITVTIWNENAETNFRMMSDFRPYIRLLDQSDDSVIARYDCGESLNDGTALVLCELFRIGEAWLFRALGESCKGGLSAMAKRYGVNS